MQLARHNQVCGDKQKQVVFFDAPVAQVIPQALRQPDVATTKWGQRRGAGWGGCRPARKTAVADAAVRAVRTHLRQTANGMACACAAPK